VLNNINGAQNDPPFAGDDFAYTTISKPVSGSFIINDKDPNGEPLSFNGTSINAAGPANNVGFPLTTTQGGYVQFYSNGTYLYTPPSGYIGPDLINYTICDSTAIVPQPLCASASLHMLVGPGINISGKVWDDANGNVIDEGVSEPETNAGGQLYVNLVDSLGYVISVAAVANDGTYSFNNAAPGRSYSLVLSTIQGNPGSPSVGSSLPTGWVNTGESRNGIIDNGSIGIIDNRLYGYANASNMNFGIEQIPTSDPHYTNIATPSVGQLITLNGGANPPQLSGTDGEDCTLGCTLASHSVSIDAVPLNANLLYNGVLVTSGQVINNFNPALLKVQITPVTVGSLFTLFYYSFVDAAGVKDPAPVVYSLTWTTILPVKGLTLSASRTGNTVALNWKTISEINSDYFETERSTDGRNYVKIGGRIKAAGNSNTEKTYDLTDDIREIQSCEVYYRVKLTDLGGKYAYSNVAIVKLPENSAIRVLPNPFTSEITISISVEQNSSFGARMTDISGRTIFSNTQKITKEAPKVTVKDLGGLIKGVYLLEVTDLQTGKKKTFKLEKNN
jgi:hypothetical protein